LANALLDPGDRVLVEQPTFPNVIGIFLGSGADVVGLKCDDEGLITEHLPGCGANSKIKLIHLTPGSQYPLGMKLSLSRRKEILEWAVQNDVLVVENDYENEISQRNSTLPTLYSLDSNQRTLYLGTFNRLLYPSIRLGFMVVPMDLAPAITALQAHSHRFVSPYLQEVMRQFIDKNYLMAHLRNLVKVATEREKLFKSLFPLTAEVGEWTNKGDAGSLNLTFALHGKDGGLSKEKQLLKQLHDSRCAAHPLSRCYLPGQDARGGVILGYAAVSPPLMREKLDRLRRQIANPKIQSKDCAATTGIFFLLTLVCIFHEVNEFFRIIIFTYL
jgi:GntR family transcriptional regulator/MocR family aminotransferase